MEKLDIGDIFEPDMEDTTTTIPPNPHPVKRERTISETSVKLAKVEEMTGFEKLRDGRSSIKLPKTEHGVHPEGHPQGHPHHHQQQPPKSMVVSIPLPSSTSAGSTAEAMQSAHSSTSSHSHSSYSHKKHKDLKDCNN